MAGIVLIPKRIGYKPKHPNTHLQYSLFPHSSLYHKQKPHQPGQKKKLKSNFLFKKEALNQSS